MSLSLSEEKIRHWPIDEPAFVVVDYAGALRHLRQSVRQLIEHARKQRQPIRLLLLDRKNKGTGIDELKTRGNEDIFLNATRVAFDDGNGGGVPGIELKPLADDAVVTIMSQRIERIRQLGQSETPAWLLNQLDQFEKGKRRPLFAAIVGSALALRPPNTDAVGQNSIAHLESRDELLADLVARERDKFWKPKITDEQELERHENLLALSTFCRGAPDHCLYAVDNFPALRIPPRDGFNQALFNQMTVNVEKSDVLQRALLGWLEPDFIGEWFVLSRFERMQSIEQKAFLEFAWHHRTATVEQFILQCHQNHPDAVASYNYFFPETGQHIHAVVRLTLAILSGWRASLLFIEEERASSVIDNREALQKQSAVADIAGQLFSLLVKHVNAAEKLDQETQVNLAASTHILITIQSWNISPKVREEYSGGFSLRELPEQAQTSILARVSRIVLSNVPIHSGAVSEANAEHNSPMQASVSKEPVPETIFSNRDSDLFYRWLQQRLSTPLAGVSDKSSVQTGGYTHAELSAKLLVDAATFFRTLAQQNAELKEQMQENAMVFEQMAHLLRAEPYGLLQDTPTSELAGRLLQDAAGFFNTLADQNPSIAEQMRENASVYNQVGILVMQDPLGILE